MEKLNLKESISLEGTSLDNKMQKTKQDLEKVLKGYQEDHNKTPGVLREIEAIQTIIKNPGVLKAYTIDRVQSFIDERISMLNDSSLADNLDQKPASELISKLTSDYDCSGIDFSKCETQEDVRKALYDEAGIEYISLQEVKNAYNNINQLVDSNGNLTSAMQNYDEVCLKAHCFVDVAGHFVLGQSFVTLSEKVPYYQSGRGIASLMDTKQNELATMMGENRSSSVQGTTGKTM